MRELDKETLVSRATEIPLDSLKAAASALTARPYVRRGLPQSGVVLRVVLVDDHEIVRDGLKALLKGVPDIAVVGEADSGRSAVPVVEELAPDVVVMDLEMPGGDGETATAQITMLDHPPRVLVLSVYSESERLIPLLKVGASGYLAKDAAATDLIEAIRAVAAGEIYVRPHVARMLAAAVRPSDAPSPAAAIRAQLAKLSDREWNVLRLVAEGYNGPEIGTRLGITAKTVDTYRQRIAEKMGFTHRTEYVRVALTAGLLSGDQHGRAQ